MTWDQCQIISFSINYNWPNFGKTFCLIIAPNAHLLADPQQAQLVFLVLIYGMGKGSPPVLVNAEDP